MIGFILERNAPNKNILYIELAFDKRNTYVLSDAEVINLMVLCKEYWQKVK